jgi:hypothetical protein
MAMAAIGGAEVLVLAHHMVRPESPRACFTVLATTRNSSSMGNQGPPLNIQPWPARKAAMASTLVLLPEPGR